MWVPIIGFVLSWGMPSPSFANQTQSYLGLVERIAGDPPWLRVAFARRGTGEWGPALESVRSVDELKAAPDALPGSIRWHVCRDGRVLRKTVSKRRRYRIYSELGTQALQANVPLSGAAAHDRRFEMFDQKAATRPFVSSTQPDACGLGVAVQPASASAIAHLVATEIGTGGKKQLRESRGWQTGGWTIAELEYEEGRHLLTIVIFAEKGEIRSRVPNARVVDWINADGDDTPDVILRTAEYNVDGYVLVYGRFAAQVAFSWIYH